MYARMIDLTGFYLWCSFKLQLHSLLVPGPGQAFTRVQLAPSMHERDVVPRSTIPNDLNWKTWLPSLWFLTENHNLVKIRIKIALLLKSVLFQQDHFRLFCLEPMHFCPITGFVCSDRLWYSEKYINGYMA